MDRVNGDEEVWCESRWASTRKHAGESERRGSGWFVQNMGLVV